MKTAQLIVNLLIVGLLGYIAYQTHGTLKMAEIVEYWENKDFKTDTVIFYVDYSKLPKPIYNQVVPPAIVIQYIDSTSHNNYLVSNDSLIYVVDSLKNEITKINTEFLLNFKKSPKLIYGEFSLDSIRLDLFDIAGNINSNRYHINLSRYNYNWSGNTLNAKKYPRYSPEISWDATGYLGVSIFEIKPLIGGEVALNTGRFRFTSNNYLTLGNNSTFRSLLTTGYRIR